MDDCVSRRLLSRAGLVIVAGLMIRTLADNRACAVNDRKERPNIGRIVSTSFVQQSSVVTRAFGEKGDDNKVKVSYANNGLSSLSRFRDVKDRPLWGKSRRCKVSVDNVDDGCEECFGIDDCWGINPATDRLEVTGTAEWAKYYFDIHMQCDGASTEVFALVNPIRDATLTFLLNGEVLSVSHGPPAIFEASEGWIIVAGPSDMETLPHTTHTLSLQLESKGPTPAIVVHRLVARAHEHFQICEDQKACMLSLQAFGSAGIELRQKNSLQFGCLSSQTPHEESEVCQAWRECIVEHGMYDNVYAILASVQTGASASSLQLRAAASPLDRYIETKAGTAKSYCYGAYKGSKGEVMHSINTREECAEACNERDWCVQFVFSTVDSKPCRLSKTCTSYTSTSSKWDGYLKVQSSKVGEANQVNKDEDEDVKSRKIIGKNQVSCLQLEFQDLLSWTCDCFGDMELICDEVQSALENNGKSYNQVKCFQAVYCTDDRVCQSSQDLICGEDLRDMIDEVEKVKARVTRLMQRSNRTDGAQQSRAVAFEETTNFKSCG